MTPPQVFIQPLPRLTAALIVLIEGIQIIYINAQLSRPLRIKAEEIARIMVSVGTSGSIRLAEVVSFAFEGNCPAGAGRSIRGGSLGAGTHQTM
jgi:hypothetical protein